MGAAQGALRASVPLADGPRRRWRHDRDPEEHHRPARPGPAAGVGLSEAAANAVRAPGSAARRHDEMVAARQAQYDRTRGRQTDTWGAIASRFRADPKRELDPFLRKLASFVRPDDVLVDIGGGAGRNSLPMARRCREVINVEPSA